MASAAWQLWTWIGLQSDITSEFWFHNAAQRRFEGSTMFTGTSLGQQLSSQCRRSIPWQRATPLIFSQHQCSAFHHHSVARDLAAKRQELAHSIHTCQCLNQEMGTVEGTTQGRILKGKEYTCIQAELLEGGAIGLITLDRPKALNALSEALMKEVLDALQTYDADPQVFASFSPLLADCYCVVTIPL